MNKKGLTAYIPLVLGFAGLLIVAIATLSVLVEMKGTFTEGSTEYNATGKAVQGIEKVTNFSPLMGIVLAITVVLGLLFTAFGFGALRREGGAM